MFLQHLISFAYPLFCPGCEQKTAYWEFAPLCYDCFTKIVFLSPVCCQWCGVPMPSAASIKSTGNQDTVPKVCLTCRLKKNKSVQIRSAVLYQKEGAVREMLLALKHSRKLVMLRPLVHLMCLRFPLMMEKKENEIVTPVPLHLKRFMQRGFNQALLLGRSFATNLGLPFAPAILKRVKATTPQSGNTKQRSRNVRQAFAVKSAAKIKDKEFLLIDDVMTTGATLEACAKTLVKAGAKSVRAFTVARALL